MPGGRPRKTHRLRVLEGGRGKSRPLTPDLAAPSDPIERPRTLTVAERAAWKRHAGWIRRLKLESSVDQGQFLAMVRFYCRAQAADKIIARHGLTMETLHNGEIQRPEVAISERCWKTYSQLADKFGLSAAARAKLSPGEQKPEDAEDLPAELRARPGGA